MSSKKMFLKMVPESKSGEFELVLRDGVVLPHGNEIALGDEIFLGNPFSGELHGYVIVKTSDDECLGEKVSDTDINLLAVTLFQQVCEDIQLMLSEYTKDTLTCGKRCWDFEGVTRNLSRNEAYLHIGGFIENAYEDMLEERESDNYTGESDYISVYPGLVIAKRLKGGFEFLIVSSVNFEENTYQVVSVDIDFLSELYPVEAYFNVIKGMLLDNAA